MENPCKEFPIAKLDMFSRLQNKNPAVLTLALSYADLAMDLQDRTADNTVLRELFVDLASQCVGIPVNNYDAYVQYVENKQKKI